MTTGNLLLDRQLARWYALKDHPVQLALVAAVRNGIRFPLVPAGRRSGKTERFNLGHYIRGEDAEGQLATVRAEAATLADKLRSGTHPELQRKAAEAADEERRRDSFAAVRKRFLERHAAQKKPRTAAAYKQAFWEHRSRGEHTEGLFPGAENLLVKLRARGDTALGIATGKSRRGVAHLIEKHGWEGWFATIQTSDDHPSKPHPSFLPFQ